MKPVGDIKSVYIFRSYWRIVQKQGMKQEDLHRNSLLSGIYFPKDLLKAVLILCCETQYGLTE